MDVDVISHNYINNFYKPFFPNSVNVLSGATNSGKTTLLINCIKNQKNCFVEPFSKVIVVLCNESVNANNYLSLNSEELQVETCFLNEFIPEEILSENVVLIFEDVSAVTPVLTATINVTTHHENLNSCFLVTQSILKEEQFRHLLSLSHRVIVFFSGIAANKIALYIKKFFYVNQDAKDYLIDIITYAEKNKSIVLFELNDVNGIYQTKYFAIINFDTFFNETKKQTFIIPKMIEDQDFQDTFNDYETSVTDNTNFPPHSFLLVNAKNVVLKSQQEQNKEKKKSTKEQLWNYIDETIQDDIMTGIRFKYQQTCLNLAKHILSCKHLIISSDAKTIKIKDFPNQTVSVLDYLNIASRPAAPKEIIEPIYYKITKLLLSCKTPKFFIRNKNLFMLPKKTKKTHSSLLT